METNSKQICQSLQKGLRIGERTILDYFHHLANICIFTKLLHSNSSVRPKKSPCDISVLTELIFFSRPDNFIAKVAQNENYTH